MFIHVKVDETAVILYLASSKSARSFELGMVCNRADAVGSWNQSLCNIDACLARHRFVADIISSYAFAEIDVLFSPSNRMYLTRLRIPE